MYRENDQRIYSRSQQLSTTTATVSDLRWAPKRFAQIKNIEDTETRGAWIEAHYKENDGLFDKPDVLRMTPLPGHIDAKGLLHLHTIYTVKSDGRKKARTVLGAGKDKLDTLDLGYERSFSPTARNVTVRLHCAYAAARDLVIRGGDVTQAFSQGDWPDHVKKVYARMPDGYNAYYKGVFHCCEVGNLYGHPIAGRNWYMTLCHRMKHFGYEQSAHDPCKFHKYKGDDEFHMVLYVDDILTFSPKDSTLYTDWKEWFDKEFMWTDFDTNLHEFTSVNITQKHKQVKLDMARCIEDMILEHCPGGFHRAFSMPADTDLSKAVHKAAVEKDDKYANSELGKKFRRLVMQLLYCAHQARPDIAVSVSMLTRVQAWPSPDLLKRAEKILACLSGTKELGPIYKAKESVRPTPNWAPRVEVEGASDASFDVAHSTSGHVFFSSGAAIAWATKKQRSIALSSCEAEVVAGSEAACQAVAIRGLLEELHIKQHEPTTLSMDNTAAIDVSSDPMYYDRSKHIARRDLFIRELVANNIIKPEFIRTEDNPADALIKPLPKAAFIKHRNKLLGI